MPHPNVRALVFPLRAPAMSAFAALKNFVLEVDLQEKYSLDS
jgi:hypothetical protein